MDVNEVRKETLACGDHYDALVGAADLYGVFEDLYGPDVMFKPCIDLQVAYDMPGEDDYVLPVHRGNVLKPGDARHPPEVAFRSVVLIAWLFEIFSIFLSKIRNFRQN